jgi:hypothetical protein
LLSKLFRSVWEVSPSKRSCGTRRARNKTLKQDPVQKDYNNNMEAMLARGPKQSNRHDAIILTVRLPAKPEIRQLFDLHLFNASS